MTAADLPSDLRYSDVPCHAWCEDRPGHPFDTLNADQTREIRAHTMNIDTLVLDNDPRQRAEGAYVDIIDQEEQNVSDGGAPTLTGPLIALDASNVYLTAAEALQLAAALVEAADKLEAIR